MRNALAACGAIVILMWALGSFGVGHFRLYYGPDDFTCTKATKEQP